MFTIQLQHTHTLLQIQQQTRFDFWFTIVRTCVQVNLLIELYSRTKIIIITIVLYKSVPLIYFFYSSIYINANSLFWFVCVFFPPVYSNYVNYYRPVVSGNLSTTTKNIYNVVVTIW